MTVLIDTNFLFSVLDQNDINHRRADKALTVIKAGRALVDAPVLVELFYLANKFLGYSSAIKAISEVRDLYSIEPLLSEDMQRMEDLMQRYQDARFDYTDVAIMALSERLKITTIYTFDRRDFVVFRPIHCPALELLPT